MMSSQGSHQLMGIKSKFVSSIFKDYDNTFQEILKIHCFLGIVIENSVAE